MKKILVVSVLLLTTSGCAVWNTPVPNDWRYVPGRGYVSTNPKDFNYFGNKSHKIYRNNPSNYRKYK